MPYEQFPSLVKAIQKFKKLRSQRSALGGPNSPRRPPATTRESPQVDNNKKVKFGDAPVEPSSSVLPQSVLKFLNRDRNRPLRFSSPQTNLATPPPPPSLSTPQQPPPKGRQGPGFGGGSGGKG